MFDAAVQRLACAIRAIAGMLLVVVASAMVAVILGRYIGFATAWADEVARIAFIWCSCLGAASGTHRGLHFAIALIASKRQGRARKVLETATALIVIAMCALLAWATTQSIPVAQLSSLPALGISRVWFHSAVTAFAVLSVLFATNRLHVIWRRP